MNFGKQKYPRDFVPYNGNLGNDYHSGWVSLERLSQSIRGIATAA